MIAGTSVLLPNYCLPCASRFSSACPCRYPTNSVSLSLFCSHPLSRSVFFSELARASTRASPRKASSRAIPVITTTSIFVKSLSPLSSSPSSPFLPLRRPPLSLSPPPRSGPSICRFINPVVMPDENRQPHSRAIFSKL